MLVVVEGKGEVTVAQAATAVAPVVTVEEAVTLQVKVARRRGERVAEVAGMAAAEMAVAEMAAAVPVAQATAVAAGARQEEWVAP